MRPSFIPALSHPVTTNVLVAFCDQYRFMVNTRGRPSAEVFAELNDFYRLTEEAVDTAGGLVIKFMGDAALIVFSEELADPGIMALLALHDRAEAWFHERRIDSGLHVNAHFGEVTMGRMGSIDRLDVIGETVNICATLSHRGFALTPQAFRCLTPEHRKRFHKFTPPVTYHPERE
jgi:adenylate cyclase